MAKLPEDLLVGIEVHRDAISVELANTSLHIIAKERIEIGDRLDHEELDWIIGGAIAMSFALEGNKRSAAAICIACDGFVDEASGRIVESRNTAMGSGLDIVGGLRKHIDTPVMVVDRAKVIMRQQIRDQMESGEVSAVSLDVTDDRVVFITVSTKRMFLNASDEVNISKTLPGLVGSPDVDEYAADISQRLAPVMEYLAPELFLLSAPESAQNSLMEKLSSTFPNSQVSVNEVPSESITSSCLKLALTLSNEKRLL
ncbi:MAG: hypothetical protein VYB76_02340 [Chloroflexota bacterium]|nr:hypothetical protein [Chloroflexota bacterium]